MEIQNASGPPSLNKAWNAFLAHVPAILLILVISNAIAALGIFAFILLVVLGIAVTGGAESDTIPTLAIWLSQAGILPFIILYNFVDILRIALPAMYYSTGEVITLRKAFSVLLKRPWRNLLAVILFNTAYVIGVNVCILPGLAVALTGPIFVNKIFNTEAPVLDAFSSSFQVVYGSPVGRSFVWLQLLVWLVVGLVTLFTCGLGALLAVPVSSFYVQNAAYDKGLIRATA